MNNPDPEALNLSPRLDRRDLLKLGVAGTATALVGGITPNVAQARDDGIGVVTHDRFPVDISPEYKRFNQYNTVFNRDARKGIPSTKPIFNDSRPGFTTPEYAMSKASWTLWRKLRKHEPGESLATVHEPLENIENPYVFADSATAHARIKRVARHFGASVVGITRRDERWDYSQTLVPGSKVETQAWEEGLPGFYPKTVVIVGWEMEYEALRTAPSQVADATAFNAYSGLSYVLLHMAKFFNYLGYKAVPAVNNLGLNVPYAIAAGLGEINRMGMLQNYKYGTRLRIAKIYTDLELDEYLDKPVTFGIQSFCENCLHCADKCPSDAISRDVKPTIYKASDVKDRPYINPGVKKWHLRGHKCHDYWIESGTCCAACIACCPYNKPDFWHHRLIDRVNTILPGPLHKFMADMDLLHGYGKMFDDKAPAVFWDSKGRSYNGLKG